MEWEPNDRRPIATVYAYLADFPRHSEWAQTVERLALVRPGDATGVGARYLDTASSDGQPVAG